MKKLEALDPEEVRGTTVRGARYALPPGNVPGRITVIAVPQRQIQYVISPQFISAMRKLAEKVS